MAKVRIQLDALVIILTSLFLSVLIFSYPRIYLQNEFTSEVLDVVGFFVVVLGVLFRASGRGYKKAFSENSTRLVTSGPYTVVRNPMYLGTFLIGAGLALGAFPWWTLIPYSIIFFLRFRLEIKKEEGYLSQVFGQEYTTYCRNTPRLIPGWNSLKSKQFQDIFPWRYCVMTQELKCLLYLPLLILGLEFLEETIVWKHRHFTHEWGVFLLNLGITGALLLILMTRSNHSSSDENQEPVESNISSKPQRP